MCGVLAICKSYKILISPCHIDSISSITRHPKEASVVGRGNGVEDCQLYVTHLYICIDFEINSVFLVSKIVCCFCQINVIYYYILFLQRMNANINVNINVNNYDSIM